MCRTLLTALVGVALLASALAGPASGTWAINSDDGSGLHNVQFSGNGTDASMTTVTATPAAAATQGATSPTGAHPRVPVAPRIAPSSTTADAVRNLVLTYTGTVAATTKFTLQRAMAGRRTGQVCVRYSAAHRGARKCVYFGTVARLAHLDAIGSNRLRLTRRVPGGVLVPGTYRLQSVSIDANGLRHTFYTFFKVTSPVRRR